jgi:hypothetical protein
MPKSDAFIPFGWQELPLERDELTEMNRTDGGPGTAEVAHPRLPRCLVAAPQVLRASLPLPAELTDSTRWLAGSEEQGRLRTWLADKERALQWMNVHGVYVLPPVG